MDRTIVYPGAIPLDTDNLAPQRFAEIALGWLTQAAMGTATGVVGLPCNPTSPASMTVNVGAGAMWSEQVIDNTDYGSMSADQSPLMLMGINPAGAGTALTLSAPGTAGQSMDYLIQASFSETDGSPVTLPYVNAANPSQTWAGPNNSGTAQNTRRVQRVSLTLKAGTPATTGSQVAPAADAGATPLYVVTVANGQTTIVAGDISVATGAPFFDYPLPNASAQIADVVEAAGLTPSITDNAQLLTAIQGWAGKNIQVFTSSGTFNVPGGVTKVRVTVVGGGGGSGGSSATSASQCAPSPGGNSGSWGAGIYTVNGSITVTVGAGGSGGAAGTSGGTGGTSSFGTFLSALGGHGSTYAAAVVPPFVSGPGNAVNVASGGNIINAREQPGSMAVISTTTSYLGGSGGNGLFGGAGEGGGAAGPGSGGVLGGGGGGVGTGPGASSGSPGHAGGNGIVIVEW